MPTSLVPAGHGRAFRLGAGEQLRVATPHGSQVADTWALTLPDLAEWLSMEHTRGALSAVSPREGSLLHSNRRRPLLALVEDTSPGVHDTLIPACDEARYRLLGHEGPHRSCVANFHEALAVLGLRSPVVPSPLNVFMNVPVSPGGTLEFAPSPARAGDSVTFQALDDLVVVVSACPQDLVPINGSRMAPSDLEVQTPVPARREGET